MLSSLVSGFPIVQFLKDWIMQNGRGRPGPFYNMNDVSVYPGTQREEGSLIEGTSWRPFLGASIPSTRASNVCEVTNVLLLVQNKKCITPARYSDMHCSKKFFRIFYCNVSMILWSPSSGKKSTETTPGSSTYRDQKCFHPESNEPKTNLHKGQASSSINNLIHPLHQRYQWKNQTMPISGGHSGCFQEQNNHEISSHESQTTTIPNGIQRGDLQNTIPRLWSSLHWGDRETTDHKNKGTPKTLQIWRYS